MSELITRRKLITTGLAAAAGASGLGVAASLANRYGLLPPDHGGIYGVGETLTYVTHCLLLSDHWLARKFDRSQISKVIPVNGKAPEKDAYQRLKADNFTGWKVADLPRFPMHKSPIRPAKKDGHSSPSGLVRGFPMY